MGTINLNPPEALRRALAAHQAGNLAEAERIYKLVLRAAPKSFDALHLLGVLKAACGLHDEADRLLQKALMVEPRSADALNNRANVLQSLRRYDEALASCTRALQIRPGFAEALNNRGNILHDLKRLVEALASFDQALAIKPDYVKALNNRGIVLRDLKRPEEALACFDRALAIHPESAETLNNRANVLCELKRFNEALTCADRALALNPRYAKALHNRGVILNHLRRPEEALTSLNGALAIAPDYVEALNNLGIVLHDLGRSEEALSSISKAVAIAPDDVEALNNLGIVLHDSGRSEEASRCIGKALAIKPDYADALYNRGNVLRDQQRYDDALASYDQALAIRPDYAAAHWNEGFCRLLTGDLRLGWEKHEWRWKAAEISAPHPETIPWLGRENISGHTILLHAEQGLGDTIQFCRYAEMVKAKGARVVLEVQPSLKSLMGSLNGVDLVIARDEPPPRFDLHCPLMSLPLAFGTDIETIPSKVPYLAADPLRVAAWRERLAHRDGARIGIVWAGKLLLREAIAHRIGRRRSMRLAQFAPLARVADTSLVSLQKGDAESQSSEPPAGMELLDWTSELDDFADTAALVQALDLVISVDTSVAHLAGALGKPVWLLTHFDACWRWLLSREDSPWYPTMRIFRQPSPGDWESVMTRVAAELAPFAADRSALERLQKVGSPVPRRGGTISFADVQHARIEPTGR